MSLEVGLVECLTGICLLHRLSTQLEHDKDDHLVMIKMRVMMTLAVMVMVMVTDADYDYGDDKDQTEADDTGKGAEEHCQDDSEVEGGPHLHKDQSYPPKIQTKNTK